MSLPVLYSFRRCPYAMRARLALQISGTQCELREVVLRDKPNEMLEASPKGTVPVLIEPDGTVIDESLEVMLWALNKSDPENWLQAQQEDLEVMLSGVEDFDEHFKPQLDRYKYPNRFDLDDPIPARNAAVEYLRENLASLEKQTYLYGETASLADMALVPFVRQFANTDREWFDSHAPQGLQRWLRHILDSALFGAIMLKYPQWQSPDIGVLFPESV